jgi:hypothetical protein
MASLKRLQKWRVRTIHKAFTIPISFNDATDSAPPWSPLKRGENLEASLIPQFIAGCKKELLTVALFYEIAIT